MLRLDKEYKTKQIFLRQGYIKMEFKYGGHFNGL